MAAPPASIAAASAPSPAAASAAAPAPASAAASGVVLRGAASLQAPPRGDAARGLPIILRAGGISIRPDIDAQVEGDVEFRRGGVVIRADRLTYDEAADLARATGHVIVTRDGNFFSGPELQLEVEQFKGFFRSPTYRFARTGAGGKASRIDFIDDQRATAFDATYSSCTVDDADGEPVWILRTSELRIDSEANEGVAKDAVLRFYGVPILAAPVLSFPLSDERKSGFLPPSFGLDSRSGFQIEVPYYLNIAPNRDATFTAYESVRRGPAAEAELRYLEPSFFGESSFKILPHDDVADRSRYALHINHEGLLPYDFYGSAKVLRVSDDDYWKDFPREVRTATPRLLQTDLQLQRPFGDWQTYARVERWQVLQTVDPTTQIDSPYERLPQVGTRYTGSLSGFDVAVETEVNRFANPDDNYLLAGRQTGSRAHLVTSVARPFGTPGFTFTPKLSLNAASYSVDLPLADGRRSASRVIPTVSLDSAMTLERDTTFFGRSVVQTLEPRVFYVNTPFRSQNDLPNFDAAPRDFNFDSLFTENDFTGIDRVSDSHSLSIGATSRILDPTTGAEALRFGIAQRYRFRDQFITPDQQPQTQHFSDIAVFGSTTVVPKWNLDTSVQFDPDTHRVERSLAGFRYTPGPYRTVGLTYRLTRGLTEQYEIGWQWPVFGEPPSTERHAAAAGSSGRCGGTLYSVGRVNYSTRDSRLTDSIVGFEYDAGCWIGRIVAERLSTGRSEATTRLLVQLELIGLSRLGSNPLKVLKDNIPGYQLLREERTTNTPYTPYE